MSRQGTGGYHPHESPLTMLVPIALLALGALLAGQLFHGIFVDAETRAGILARQRRVQPAPRRTPREDSAFWVKLTPTIVMLIGLWIAWNNYIRNPGAADGFVATLPRGLRFVSNKWYFDELYDFLFVRPALWLGRLFWQRR